MTDGSDPLQEPASAPAGAATGRTDVVLAKGHLHPAVLLLRLLSAMRQAAFPLLLGVVVDRWFLVLAVVLFVAHLGYAVARYLTLEYTLTTDELRVREGLLERQERRIPLDRIQDLGFESTILRRAMGLVVVLVETASGRGVEARLDALSRNDADHLREVLLAARRDHVPVPAQTATGELPPHAPPLPEPEWLVHRSTGGELLLRGLTDLRLSAFAITGLAALEFADQIGFAVQLKGAAGGLRDWLFRFPPHIVALLLVGLLFGVMAFGVVTTTVGNLVQFHGFALTLRGNVLLRRFGLLTTRQKTLPRVRIQRVTVEQPWLRRLLGLAVVKADSAGGSRSEGEDTASGWDVVVPLSRQAGASAMLPALLPGIEQATFDWQRGSPRLVLRTALQGVLMSAIAVPIAWPAFGLWALCGLLFVPVWALLGVLVYGNLGWALGGPFFALRHGIVGRYVSYLPTAKVQAIVVRQGPLSQLLGLADLTVYVAGGSPTRLPDLTIADAQRVTGLIAADAAHAAAADW